MRKRKSDFKTYCSADDLEKKFRDGEWQEDEQRYLVVAALLDSKTPRTLESLVKQLDGPAYWETVRHKDKTGKPSEDSWLIREAGGVRRSVMYHLNALKKDGLVKVVQV
jgi:hypothetical protein